MKQFKKFGRMLAIVMILSLTFQTALPANYLQKAEAAQTAISQKKLTLEVGKSKVLKITGTKSKVTWKSSKTTVATVSKTGKVTAKKAGKATITATVDKKKYTCTVTVKAAVAANPLVDGAPFKAQAATSGNVTYIYPSNWVKTEAEATGYRQVVLVPGVDDKTDAVSSISLLIIDSEGIPEASVFDAAYSEITADSLVSQYAQQGMEVTVDGVTVNKFDTELGVGYITDFNITYNGVTMKQTIYDVYTEKNLTKITVTDISDNFSPDVKQVAKYLIDTLQVTK